MVETAERGAAELDRNAGPGGRGDLGVGQRLDQQVARGGVVAQREGEVGGPLGVVQPLRPAGPSEVVGDLGEGALVLPRFQSFTRQQMEPAALRRLDRLVDDPLGQRVPEGEAAVVALAQQAASERLAEGVDRAPLRQSGHVREQLERRRRLDDRGCSRHPHGVGREPGQPSEREVVDRGGDVEPVEQPLRAPAAPREHVAAVGEEVHHLLHGEGKSEGALVEVDGERGRHVVCGEDRHHQLPHLVGAERAERDPAAGDAGVDTRREVDERRGRGEVLGPVREHETQLLR